MTTTPATTTQKTFAGFPYTTMQKTIRKEARKMINETVIEKMRNKQIPDYYDGMYLDGYKPYEILESAHNAIIKQYTER